MDHKNARAASAASPSERAREIAQDILDRGLPGIIEAAKLDAAAAYARGLEEAARECDRRSDHHEGEARKDVVAHAQERGERNRIRAVEAATCAVAIRVLDEGNEPKAPPGPSGALAGAEEITTKEKE